MLRRVRVRSAKSALMVLGTVGFAASVGAADAADPMEALEVGRTADGAYYVKGEILVKTRSQAALERLLDDTRGTIGAVADRKALQSDSQGAVYRVQVVATEQALRTLNARENDGDEVLYSEPNYIYTTNLGGWRRNKPVNPGPDFNRAPALPTEPKDDPDLNRLYGLGRIGARDAWKTSSGGTNVIVANIDTGVDYNHPDLVNNVWRNGAEIPGDKIDNDGNGYVDDVSGWDFKNRDNKPFDDNQHGTHTAGTIAATGRNGIGIAGVAHTARVMSLKFLGGSRGSGTSEDAILAIRYAATNGAQIMSNSWGGGGRSQALFDAIKAANEKGILFVAAAGNSKRDNDSKPSYPAAYDLPNVLAVAATDESDRLATFSNFGVKSVHIAAPGVKIYSTIPGGKYAAFSGTSMACPHVAGAAVVLKAAYPNLKAVELKSVLVDSAESIDGLKSKVFNGGRLHLARAMTLANERYGAPNQSL